MLYNKNKSKELDLNLFENPTSEYRGTPFWAWNCKLEKEVLGRQIECMKEMGLGGFHMHSRTGMASPYLSDEFMNLVKYCVNKAKEEKMLAWLYDEDRWPSGAAGGLVTKEKRYRAKHLAFLPYNKEGDAKGLEEALETGKHFFYAAYAINLNGEGLLVDYKRIERDEDADNKWYAFLHINGDDPWFNNQAYVDTLDENAIKRFMDITYETYKDAIGESFGKSVPAIFTDEPQFARMSLMENAKEKQTTILPWTHLFNDKFKDHYGYDVLDYLPELIWSFEGFKKPKVKYDYVDFLTELFTKSFADQCGSWCGKHDIHLTGHMMAEASLYYQTMFTGESMRHYRSFQLPGIDMLCNYIEINTAKQAQSASRQYGREGVMSELYGVTNWDFDFRGHKFQGDWQAALGITVRVHHLSWVSMAGEAKRDYPASISYQSPWYKEYRYVEDHFARVNTALTRGKPLVNVGVIHPIESMWINMGPANTNNKRMDERERRFTSLASWLSLGQVDFDYISEALFPDLTKEVTNPIRVGHMEYNTLIVPNLDTIRKSTLDRLIEFKALGGKLIFLGSCPEYVDGLESDLVKKLYEESTVLSFEKEAILNVLKEDKLLDIYEEGQLSEKYFYNLREDNDCRWLFIARGVYVEDRDSTKENALRIEIKGQYYPQVYDTVRGNVCLANYSIRDGKTLVYANLFNHDSLLLRLGKLEDIEIKDEVDYILEEENVLLLDMAEYALDDEDYKEKEDILRADNILRQRLGWQPRMSAFPQPWTVEEEALVHKVRLRFTIESAIEYEGARLALEDAKRVDIIFNGKKIDNIVTGYFTDEDIKTVPLTTIKEGINVLELSIPFGKRTNVEWVYILGDFGIELDGTRKLITKKVDKLSYRSVTSQKMPFYASNITYINDIDLKEDASLLIRIPSYNGSMVKVLIDDKEVGKIVYSPYELIVEDIKRGKHTLKLVLLGNRHNAFGPMHNINPNLVWVGPDAWRSTGGHWSYEYKLKEMGILEKPVVKLIKYKR